jgi:hypothetical protein
MKTLEPNQRLQLAHLWRKWGTMAGVNGLDIGLKFTGGELTGEICPRVHVQFKEKDSFNLFSDDVLGQSDVIEASYCPRIAVEPQRLMGDYTPIPALRKPSDIIYPGLGIGPHTKLHAGTLGSIVWDGYTGEPGLLTNHHVIQQGQRVYQPGGFDGGGDENEIAWCQRSYLGSDGDFSFCPLKAEWVERIRESTYAEEDLNPVIPTWAELFRVGFEFGYRKVGMTTGDTSQICSGIGIYRIGYGSGVTVAMHGFQLIPPQPQTAEHNIEGSGPGDSGSSIIVVKTRGELRQVQQAGVLVGGEASGIAEEERTICCHAWLAARRMFVYWERNQVL